MENTLQNIKIYEGGIDKCKKTNREIKYIVLHYTAGVSNKSESTNLNICKYWDKSESKASADFVVDEDDIYQYNTDIKNYYTYHCGGSKYSYKGGARMYGKCTNTNSIGIEMCSFRKDGNAKASAEDEGWEIGDNTLVLTKILVKYLMEAYNIPVENVITHFDVTGKLCPRPFLCKDDSGVWSLTDSYYDTFFGEDEELSKGLRNPIYTIETLVDLNCRKGVGTTYAKVTMYEKGTFLAIYEEKDGWGETSQGWISLNSKYVKKI
ncbi:MAG: N-acetylmuramoyl-L-alanine amidase [Paludibacteraceae bacterium]|nr:N-acetylmuramoyl-L-alanine amidase [Paludibacteraceae bacterium]